MELKKVKLGRQETEYDFWKERTHLERLNMVEKLRQQLITRSNPSRIYEIRKVSIK